MSVSEGERRLLIDGKLVEASGGATFPNVDPATELVLGPTADGTAADMEAAVAAARRAFDTTAWATDHPFRAECLRQLQGAIEAEREELRAELVAEVGCPVLVTYGPQLDAPLREALTWPADMIERFPWRRDLGPKDAFGMGVETEREVWKEPVGVVGVIVPWNYPVEITLNKLGPVLAMGNTCVLKPAPDTPWNATRLGRLVAERTDIPAGVVNVVPSSDHLVGEALVSSPLVDMVAFTGSTATGRRVMQAASAHVTPVFLELGGKSVNLVLDDADFAATVPGAAASVCFHAGQGCAMPTRLLVPRSRYDEAVELAAAGLAGVSYGDPTDPANLMGPVVSARQRDRILGYVETGKAEGARLVCGGGRPAHLDRGWYVEPTLFVDVDNAMTIAREEIFGPVLVMIPYEDDDDAVRIANDSPYGLSGAITSGDLERAKAVARRIRTGTLGLNGGIWYGADAPFGGYKHSGIGRQCGIEGLEIFTETKTVGWPA
ncbi:MAG TPA: aldehyde dehydrogenase family protein [Acidimicrobiales bacterium]|nr:aldehyde dehydrogenase family protein [Acidimicrobiales bacterium]